MFQKNFSLLTCATLGWLNDANQTCFEKNVPIFTFNILLKIPIKHDDDDDDDDLYHTLIMLQQCTYLNLTNNIITCLWTSIPLKSHS